MMNKFFIILKLDFGTQIDDDSGSYSLEKGGFNMIIINIVTTAFLYSTFLA